MLGIGCFSLHTQITNNPNFSECLQESHFIFKVEPGALATFTFSLECVEKLIMD